MKTRIRKIIIMTIAILFVGVGVSFAHDPKGSQHKPRGNAYGLYKKGYDHPPGWDNKYQKPRYNARDRYRHRVVRKIRHHHYRHVPHAGTIIAFKVNEPGLKFAVVVKDHR
jgi:hypothetical protein